MRPGPRGSAEKACCARRREMMPLSSHAALEGILGHPQAYL